MSYASDLSNFTRYLKDLESGSISPQYAHTAGISTTAEGLSGSPNVDVGILTATDGVNSVGVITARSGLVATGNVRAESGIVAVGVVTATDFNSTSDVNYKKNIQTVNDSLDKIKHLRGVSFDWKSTDLPSYGVIAQELEEIIPDLVSKGEMKTVNYNGIIAVLIEAVKDLSSQIEQLKNK